MAGASYSACSPALKDFWTNLKEVGTLISLCEMRENKPIHRIRNESLCRSSLVLLCSHMESFFESLIVDILQFHESNQTPVTKLPDQLRVSQVWKDFSTMASANSGKKLEYLIAIKDNILVDNLQVCVSGSFDSDLNTKGFASPGSKEVEKLFNTVGIERIWDVVKTKTGNETLKNSLNGFVLRRHNIAHGNSGDRPAINDVTSKIKDMCRLVRVFDEIVFEYLTDNFEAEELWV
jgi:RiboL-PSP-HEPN